MKCPALKCPFLPPIMQNMGFLGTHLNTQTMLYSEKMGFQSFHRTVLRYSVLFWHHGPVPHQILQVTYPAE